MLCFQNSFCPLQVINLKNFVASNLSGKKFLIVLFTIVFNNYDIKTTVLFRFKNALHSLSRSGLINLRTSKRRCRHLRRFMKLYSSEVFSFPTLQSRQQLRIPRVAKGAKSAQLDLMQPSPTATQTRREVLRLTRQQLRRCLANSKSSSTT